MKTLVLFDGSENALRAVGFAGKMAKKIAPDIQVTLLQVVEFWETGAWGFLTLSEEKEKELISKAKQQAAVGLEKAKEMLKDTGAVVDTVILIGEPIPAILDYAEQNRPDLIIMGSRGMGPVRELVLGGICHKVLQLSKQPVVVVK
ncbi:MAG: universal stress protein [Bacillota bacterium]